MCCLASISSPAGCHFRGRYTYIVDRYQGRVAVFDSNRQFVLDIDAGALTGEGCDAPLFPFGHGLTTEDETQPALPQCG